jgi:hypothetical protein
MPIETIKCQECGSADLTEFKPGSYVCSHCESVFKVVNAASSSAAPASCEIDGCGVLAIGRCVTCGRSFCSPHRSQGENLRSYHDGDLDPRK